MTTAVQRRRGTTTEHSSFTGLEGEISVNTTKDTLVVHDGSTVGGFELARADGSNFVATSVDINGGTIDGTTIGSSSASTGAFTTLSASGEITANGGIALGDNDKATFGAGDDLQIYHDGSSNSSYIKEIGAGSFNIEASNLFLKREGGTESFIDCVTNGAVTAYYDGSAKLATTSTGIDVTGTVTADGLVSAGTAFVNLTSRPSGIPATAGALWAAQTETGNYGIVSRASSTDSFTYIGNTGSTATLGQSYGSTGSYLPLVVQTSDLSRLKVETNGDISFYEDTGTTAKLFWDASAESLGIGVVPSSPLHVKVGTNQNLEIDSAGSELRLSAVNDARSANPAIRFQAESYKFYGSGGVGPRATIDSSGNVGIGTSSPSTALQVGDGTDTANWLRLTGTVSDLYIGQNPVNNSFGQTNAAKILSVASYPLAMGTANAYPVIFGTNDTERMRIDASGNVGIGTSSPSEKLEIAGAASATSTGIAIKNGSATRLRIFHNDNAGTNYISSHDVGAAQALFIMSGNNLLLSGGGGTEHARIDSSGNVILAAGTGTLQTATAGTSNLRLGVNAGNSIESGGNYNVLVGDEAGTAITTGDENTFVGYAAGDATTTGFQNTAVGQNALTSNTTGTINAALGTGALQNATTADGNTAVGAGAQLFTTTGAGNTSVGRIALFINTTGGNNVAIGKESLFNNTTASDNTAVGYQAGYTNTTGTRNTFVGRGTGYTSNGDDNTAVGRNALYNNTTGSGNAVLGVDALTANTTGGLNTAIGYLALNANTTANNNTAVGYQSLVANTTGTNNVAVGQTALDANTTGSENVALGSGALGANTTANDNTAVGGAALAANTTGADNTAIGRVALVANTTGANNVAIGRNALLANTTASNNTAVGYAAGNALTNGHSNQFIGKNAGGGVVGGTASQGNHNIGIGLDSFVDSVVLTTGSHNIAIGNFTRTTAADSDYATVIGYNVAGEAGYTTIGRDASDIRASHGNVTWATVSDERYKKDIVDSTTGLSFINALRPRTFKYRTLGELPETFSAYKAGSTEVFKNSDTNHGFIAQEIKAAIDADDSIKDGFKLWDDREDGSQEVAEAALLPVLVKAIQELSTQLDAALARITTLEGK
jgi:trimeric autotransporter adhesin